MSETSGKRLSQKKEAPSLMVIYLCPECGQVELLDAYDGPPSCSGPEIRHLPVWMDARGIE